MISHLKLLTLIGCDDDCVRHYKNEFDNNKMKMEWEETTGKAL